MAVASSFGLWMPILIVLVIGAALLGSFRMRMMLATIAVAVGFTDGILVSSLKKIVGRPRPHEVMEGVRTLDLARAKPRFLALNQPLQENISEPRIRARGGNSFPSGHAANNFTVAVICAIFYRRWGWLVFLPALLVAYSRIYVGAHWPSDVLISSLLGLGCGALIAAGMEALWRRWGEKIAPGIFARYPTLFAA